MQSTAAPAGYTREILADGGPYSLHLFIRPDTDLDGRFPAYDADAGEMIRVNGWNFEFEELGGVSL